MSGQIARAFGLAVQSEDQEKILELLDTNVFYREKNTSTETVPREHVPSLLLPPRRVVDMCAKLLSVNEYYGDYILKFKLVHPNRSEVADDELRLQIEDGVVCSIVAF